MSKYLQISIPEQCHENWDTMLPEEKGRHCLVCQKTVIDFSLMSDAEIINFFEKNTGKTCGRFTTEQLSQNYKLPQKQYGFIKYIFHFTIPALLVTLKTNAKAVVNKFHKTEIVPTKQKLIQGDTIVVKKDSSITITGKILDEKEVPVPFASVVIKGTRFGVSADKDGSFKIKVKESDTLRIAAVSFENQEISIAKFRVSHKVVLKRLEKEYIIGKVIPTTNSRVKVKDIKSIKLMDSFVVKGKIVDENNVSLPDCSICIYKTKNLF